jgi:hypothetical protein
MVTMELSFRGQSVISEDYGYTVSLNLTGGYEVRIETDFSVQNADGDFQLSPGLDPEVNSQLLHTLVGHAVTTSVAEESGTLRLDFDNGARLRANPDDSFEAWTIAGPHGMKIACMPGGELAIWSPETND